MPYEGIKLSPDEKAALTRNGACCSGRGLDVDRWFPVDSAKQETWITDDTKLDPSAPEKMPTFVNTD